MNKSDQIMYFLECSEFLRDENWDGWWSCFKDRLPQPLLTLAKGVVTSGSPSMPEAVPVVSQPVKRQRCSPNRAAPRTVQVCVGCQSADVQDDVDLGSAVCLSCGRIQPQMITETAFIDAQFRMSGDVSRYVAHRYSRVVYLQSMLASTLGETVVHIAPIHLLQLCDRVRSIESSSRNPTTVRRLLQDLKLPVRYLRHAPRIANLVWKDCSGIPADLGHSERADVYRLFRRYENAWERADSASLPFKRSRKKFLNYRVLWRHIVKELGLPHLLGWFPSLRNQRKQREADRMIEAVRNLF